MTIFRKTIFLRFTTTIKISQTNIKTTCTTSIDIVWMSFWLTFFENRFGFGKLIIKKSHKICQYFAIDVTLKVPINLPVYTNSTDF